MPHRPRPDPTPPLLAVDLDRLDAPGGPPLVALPADVAAVILAEQCAVLAGADAEHREAGHRALFVPAVQERAGERVRRSAVPPDPAAPTPPCVARPVPAPEAERDAHVQRRLNHEESRRT